MGVKQREKCSSSGDESNKDRLTDRKFDCGRQVEGMALRSVDDASPRLPD